MRKRIWLLLALILLHPLFSSAAENKGLGVIVEDLPEKPYLKGTELHGAEPLGVASLPSAFDWRDHNGENFVSSVKSQGACNACFAFVTVAALESKLLIEGRLDLDLSEQIILSLSGAGDCSGGYISVASDFLKNVGDTIESCWPYQAAYQPATDVCKGWEENSYRFHHWDWAYPVNDPETLKRIIYFHGPAVAIFKIFNDLYSYRGGVYAHEYGEFEVYHAVLVIGWDDDIEAFIAKNSWGESWGEDGFIKVAYSEVVGDTEFGFQTFYYGDASLTGRDTAETSDGGGCFIDTAAYGFRRVK